MELSDIITRREGDQVRVVYREDDPLANAENVVLRSVLAFCIVEGKLVVVYAPHKKAWEPPGGAIDPGETHDEALVREVQEETNMRITYSEIIGYQDAFRPDKIDRQVRYACTAEPIGPFEGDPDGEITKVHVIDPAEYRSYFDWGKIGDRGITRARELCG